MSNPAVVKLQKKKIGRQSVWLDDNFGEAIHIHIDSIRVDLTNEEFVRMCSDICDAINELVMVDGFDCHRIDPVYLEVMLWKNLSGLRAVKIDQVPLKEMLAPGNNHKVVLLPESRGVKALDRNTEENDVVRASHHAGQTSKERLDLVYESIRDNGYPYNGEYIIMYGDDNIIRDGQHRAACLWKLQGDVSVPVMRLYFEDYVTPSLHVPFWKKTKLYRSARDVLKQVSSPGKCYQYLRVLKKKKKRKKLEKERDRYIQKYSGEAAEIKEIFDQK